MSLIAIAEPSYTQEWLSHGDNTDCSYKWVNDILFLDTYVVDPLVARTTAVAIAELVLCVVGFRSWDQIDCSYQLVKDMLFLDTYVSDPLVATIYMIPRAEPQKKV